MKHPGLTHSWSRHECGSVERYREIPTQWKGTAWEVAERCQVNYPPSGKVLGVCMGEGVARLKKKSRNTQGSAERC